MNRSIIPNLSTLLLLSTSVTCWAAHPSRGLWVGEVALNAVNEATGAVGDSNTYEFTDPEIATSTSDTAFLRLIVHVNGAGQAELLKSVALYENSTDTYGESDILLITNPALYSNYPGIARRIASAFYDFGDPFSVYAVQLLIDTSVDKAVADVFAGIDSAVTLEDLVDETNQDGLLDVIVNNADVQTAYLDRSDSASFITDDFFDLAQVLLLSDAVAESVDAGTDPSAYEYEYDASTPYAPFALSPAPLSPIPPTSSEFDTVRDAAVALVTASFYGDTRGVDAVVNILVAAANASTGADLLEKQANAFAAAEAAWHNAADLTQAYNRFLAGSAYASLEDILPPIAAAEAVVALGRSSLEADIISDVEDKLLEAAQAAYTEAATVFAESLNSDTRAQLVLNALIAETATAVAAQVLIDAELIGLTEVANIALGNALAAVQTSPILPTAPSELYSDFVRDEDYSEAALTAAQTAVNEAHFQFDNGLDDPSIGSSDEADMRLLVAEKVSKALAAIRNDAAALPIYSAKLDGSLAAGGALTGEIYLPALAPSNPFLHRLHPDHTEGFPITRLISMTVDTVDGGGNYVQAGYGVSQLSGTYSEEIFGLHKLLGPQKDIGLKTSGSFTLNRLTFVDTLNF